MVRSSPGPRWILRFRIPARTANEKAEDDFGHRVINADRLQKQHAATEQSDLDGNVETVLLFASSHSIKPKLQLLRNLRRLTEEHALGRTAHRKRRSKSAECCQDRCQTRFSVCLPSWPGGTNYLI
jgi:hypothetical protein